MRLCSGLTSALGLVTYVGTLLGTRLRAHAASAIDAAFRAALDECAAVLSGP